VDNAGLKLHAIPNMKKGIEIILIIHIMVKNDESETFRLLISHGKGSDITNHSK